MGQGGHNSLPLLIAEELEVEWALVRIELSGANDAYANPSKKYQSSGQSAAIRGFYLPLRTLAEGAPAAVHVWVAGPSLFARMRPGAIVRYVFEQSAAP